MPSKTPQQQRLFGMVTKYLHEKSAGRGKEYLEELTDNYSKSLADKIKSIADGQRKKTGDRREFTKGVDLETARDFARTKHADMVQVESVLKFNDYVNSLNEDSSYRVKMKFFCNDGENEDIIDVDIHNKNDEKSEIEKAFLNWLGADRYAGYDSVKNVSVNNNSKYRVEVRFFSNFGEDEEFVTVVIHKDKDEESQIKHAFLLWIIADGNAGYEHVE